MQLALRRLTISFAMALSISLQASANEAKSCSATGGRAVMFNTTEGSQISIDLSPDGKWIVFDMLGDIYMLPIEGGTAKRLTSGFGWDARPVWSPDGSKIAFISDRMGVDQVFVVNAADGTQLRQVTDGAHDAGHGGRTIEGAISSAEWMPDSAHILMAGRKFPVPVANSSRIAQATKFESNIYFGGSSGLYYFKPKPAVDNLPGRPGLDTKPSYEVWKLTDRASAAHMTGLDGQFIWSSEPPAISADGRYLVYRDRSPIEEANRLDPAYAPTIDDTHIDTIRVYDQHQKENRVLIGPTMSPGWRSNGANRNTIGFSSSIRYAISSDSKSLFLAYGGKIHRVDIESGHDTPIPMSVEVDQCLAPMVRHRFTIEQGDLQVKNLRSITKSQDGKQMVFSALRRLYILDTRHRHPRVLNAQQEGQFEPAYSPDGRWIAYVTWSDTAGGQVWRVRPDGSRAEKLTNTPGYYLSPTWSPDGTVLAFAGSTDLSIHRSGFDSAVYGGNLYVLSLHNGSLRKLPQQVRLGTPLSFSSDGRRISFTPHNGSDLLKLHSVSLNGANERDQKVDRFFQNYGLSSAAVDPTGSAFAAVKFGNLYLITCGKQRDSVGDFSSIQCKEIQVTREGGNDPRWRDGGQTLEWSFANTYYRASLTDLLSRNGQASSAAMDRPSALKKLEVTHIDLKVARPQNPGAIAFKGARVITMRGDEVIEEGVVVIRNGRIEQIGDVANTRIPQDAEVLDLRGKTIVPGLIDAHAHFNEYPRDLLAGNHWEPLISLAYGITTIKNPSNGGDHAFAYAELVEAGDMVGPRMFGTPGLVDQRVGQIKSLEDALHIENRSRRLGAKLIKYHTGFSRWERRWIIEAANQLGLNVAAHLPASQYLLGRPNLSTVYDGTTSSEHEISDASDSFDDVKQFLVRSGVGVCFTPLAGNGGYPAKYWGSIERDVRMQRFYLGKVPASSIEQDSLTKDSLLPLRQDAEANAKLVADIAGGGGQVMIGSHGDQGGIGMHLEMWAHVHGGMTPHQVLRAATLSSAWGLGVESDVGSLDVGKIADILVLDKNPLNDIRNSLSLALVMKGGVVRKATTLDEIWPKSQALPQWRLQGVEPLHTSSSSSIHTH